MLAYLNNWITQLTADLAVDGQFLALGSEADRLAISDQYFMTLTASTEQLASAPHEIVLLVNSGGQWLVQRAQEGTEQRAWPAGTLVYCSITAGVMTTIVNSLQQFDDRLRALESGSGGGGEGTPL